MSCGSDEEATTPASTWVVTGKVLAFNKKATPKVRGGKYSTCNNVGDILTARANSADQNPIKY